MAEERNPPRPAPAADYDQFVDWGKRLAREGPFFRRLFDVAGVRSVADVGAGSGKHAVMFASWGLEVYALDPDESMLAQAEVNAREAGVALARLPGGFGEVAALLPHPVEAVTCLGNALPHVAGRHGLRVALDDLAEALVPGGTLVLHLLNHHRLLDTRPRSIPPVVRDTPEGTRVFLRVLDYPEPPGGGEPEGILFDFLTLTKGADGEWTTAWRSSVHTALPADLLAEELARAGFEGIEVFGDHERKLLDPATDESVVVVARKGR